MSKLISTLAFLLIFNHAAAVASDAPAVPVSEPTPAQKQSKAYQEHTQKMNLLDEKVRTSEEAFQKLVLQKRHAHSSEEKQKIIEEMKLVYAEYSKDMDQLIGIKKMIKYRFPSEGDATERSYSNLEKKSPDELEKTVDLSTTLSNTKLAVDEKYKSFMPAKPLVPKSQQKKAHENHSKDAAKQKITLER